MNLDPAKLIPWAIAAGILFATYQWAPNVSAEAGGFDSRRPPVATRNWWVDL